MLSSIVESADNRFFQRVSIAVDYRVKNGRQYEFIRLKAFWSGGTRKEIK